ncbi:Retrovirus-related Pol polyprotein from transposon TNT 1-94 [Apostasia shenzhenica]|uniref:Retrovirus-related Pol polyprotein from transposon TNT 1-94 n=1 Tax=Apostasia shenzhenica TaxID=1088818 RepID=A0A2I0B949_9ASPA|nr:Retrovirus-related Pol polyprotein from transposon TNT 1-94 [Apostasia shenzhenica]
MEQPPGFTHPLYPSHVCQLHKSLYGLKQAPRAWFNRLGGWLQTQGFSGSKTHTSLFYRCTSTSKLYILIYVDDILVTGNNPNEITTVIQSLSREFSVRDLGHAHYFLGIEVHPHSVGCLLSQSKYILGLLQRANMDGARPISTPTTVISTKSSTPLSDPSLYRSIVGALQYVTITRPDIAFAVNRACQYMHTPTEEHWAAVKCILRYLKSTILYGLTIHHHTPFTFHAFSDADWGGSPEDRRSTGGFAIFLGKNLVSWTSKKQPTVSRSSTEVEYKAIANANAELIWLQSLLIELQIPTNGTPTLWCDNIGATYLTANPIFHARTKHIEIDFHFVRERVATNQLKVSYISTKDQVADIFTKPLSRQRFELLRTNLGIVSPTPRLRGSNKGIT